MSKWYESEINRVSYYVLKPPYDSITIGCDPADGMTKATADSYDVFINVSDTARTTFEPSRPGQFMHWYPVNECGLWNQSYLYWLKTVLDYHYSKNHKIYLHCHAGAYRSPSAAVLWLQSRGHTDQEAVNIADRGLPTYRLWKSYGNLPKSKDDIFRLMNAHPTWSLGGILHELPDKWNRENLNGYVRTNRLKHHYFKFYYRPKWWLKDKKEFVVRFFQRLGWRKEGVCTYIYRRKHFWVWPENAEEMDKEGKHAGKNS